MFYYFQNKFVAVGKRQECEVHKGYLQGLTTHETSCFEFSQK